MSTSIRAIELPVDGIEALAQEAKSEGYRFFDRLQADWADGSNRFSGPGETLLGAFVGDELVAVGGLNCDPFAGDSRIGRLRRIYVRRAWRRQGIGEALVVALLRHARRSFAEARLSAENPAAAGLYERLGFRPFACDQSTHRMFFRAES